MVRPRLVTSAATAHPDELVYAGFHIFSDTPGPARYAILGAYLLETIGQSLAALLSQVPDAAAGCSAEQVRVMFNGRELPPSKGMQQLTIAVGAVVHDLVLLLPDGRCSRSAVGSLAPAVGGRRLVRISEELHPESPSEGGQDSPAQTLQHGHAAGSITPGSLSRHSLIAALTRRTRLAGGDDADAAGGTGTQCSRADGSGSSSAGRTAFQTPPRSTVVPADQLLALPSTLPSLPAFTQGPGPGHRCEATGIFKLVGLTCGGLNSSGNPLAVCSADGASGSVAAAAPSPYTVGRADRTLGDLGRMQAEQPQQLLEQLQQQQQQQEQVVWPCEGRLPHLLGTEAAESANEEQAPAPVGHVLAALAALQSPAVGSAGAAGAFNSAAGSILLGASPRLQHAVRELRGMLDSVRPAQSPSPMRRRGVASPGAGALGGAATGQTSAERQPQMGGLGSPWLLFRPFGAARAPTAAARHAAASGQAQSAGTPHTPGASWFGAAGGPSPSVSSGAAMSPQSFSFDTPMPDQSRSSSVAQSRDTSMPDQTSPGRASPEPEEEDDDYDLPWDADVLSEGMCDVLTALGESVFNVYPGPTGMLWVCRHKSVEWFMVFAEPYASLADIMSMIAEDNRGGGSVNKMTVLYRGVQLPKDVCLLERPPLAEAPLLQTLSSPGGSDVLSRSGLSDAGVPVPVQADPGEPKSWLLAVRAFHNVFNQLEGTPCTGSGRRSGGPSPMAVTPATAARASSPAAGGPGGAASVPGLPAAPADHVDIGAGASTSAAGAVGGAAATGVPATMAEPPADARYLLLMAALGSLGRTVLHRVVAQTSDAFSRYPDAANAACSLLDSFSKCDLKSPQFGKEHTGSEPHCWACADQSLRLLEPHRLMLAEVQARGVILTDAQWHTLLVRWLKEHSIQAAFFVLDHFKPCEGRVTATPMSCMLHALVGPVFQGVADELGRGRCLLCMRWLLLSRQWFYYNNVCCDCFSVIHAVLDNIRHAHFPDMPEYLLDTECAAFGDPELGHDAGDDGGELAGGDDAAANSG